MHVIRLYRGDEWIGIVFPGEEDAIDAFLAIKEGLGNPSLFYNVVMEGAEEPIALPLGVFDRVEQVRAVGVGEVIVDHWPEEE